MIIGDPAPLRTSLDLNREQLPTAIDNHSPFANHPTGQAVTTCGDGLL
jgi:hypothetical protein